MISLKIKIKECTIVENYAKQYSHAFRIVYANFNNLSKQLENKILKKNNLLDSHIYSCIVSEINIKKEQEKSSKKSKQTLIIKYGEEMSLETDKNKRFKLGDKRNKLIGNLEKDIVFGGKSNIQNYVRQLNKYNGFGNIENKILAEKYLKKYRDQRIIPYYSIGDANLKGNRKFNFNLFENEVTFKPNRHNHYSLKLLPDKKQKSQLKILQNVLNTNPIPVTVSITKDFIVLTYDNEKMAGFAFNKTEYKRAKKENKSIPAKLLSRTYFLEQIDRQLKNKNKNCVCAIDMNPEYIGLTIRDAKLILFTRCFDLSKLLSDTEGNGTKEIKYNLGNIYKQIFSICNHFKVAYFFTEELKFEHNSSLSHSANRKNQSLWCREFQKRLITKHCQNLGIIQLLRIYLNLYFCDRGNCNLLHVLIKNPFRIPEESFAV